MEKLIISFNKEEEMILNELSNRLGIDKISTIKKSIFELYEDIKDLEIIKDFENREKKGKVKFLKSGEINFDL